MKNFFVLLAVMTWLRFPIAVEAQGAQGPAPSLEERRLQLEERKASLDHERLDFEKGNAERLHTLEVWKTVATAVSVMIPLLVALGTYIFQVRTRRQDEALQFQLKVAEIAMNSRDSNQARRKAEFLTKLFPDRLSQLGRTLESQDYPFFGSTNETREGLLRLLVEYPHSRADLIRGWQIVFPRDSADSHWNAKSESEKSAYKWFDELKKDTTLNRNRASAP